MKNNYMIKVLCVEVLTGNITNVDDVLDVALAQYLSIESNSKSRSVDNDAPLQIRQVLDRTTDTDGNECETVAVTALLIIDEQGQSVSASEYATHRMTGSNGLNEYSVSATHTTHLETRTNDPTYGTQAIRVYSMRTVLTYGTAMTASKLLHRCTYSRDVADYDSGYIEDDPVYYPSAGQTYMFTPFTNSEDGWVPRYVLGAYVQTSVEVFAGNCSFTICNNLQMNVNWSSVPGYSEGW